MSEPALCLEDEVHQPSAMGKLTRGLSVRLRLLLALTCFVALPSFVRGDLFWLELSSHLRPHCFVVLFLGSFWLAAAGRWKWLVFVLPTCVLLGASILPWYWPRAAGLPEGESRTLRLLLANVLSSNSKHQLLLDLVAAERPDVLVLLEVDSGWIESLASLKGEYPFHHEVPRFDNFGIALYSRLPISDLHMTELSADLPSIVGTLQLKGRPVRLIATHPLPPLNGQYFRQRNQQLEHLADVITPDTILIGDLNLTMWSHYYERLEERSGLRNTRRGFGILPTWPVGLGPARIPLDHCLVSADFRVDDLRRGPDVGGDHLPLIVDLYLPLPSSD